MWSGGGGSLAIEYETLPFLAKWLTILDSRMLVKDWTAMLRATLTGFPVKQQQQQQQYNGC